MGDRGFALEAGSDALLIGESARRPDRFAAVFDRHFPAVHRYLARRAGSEVADDLALQCFTLATLEPAQRDVLLLYAWEELSYEEISAALSVPVGTVRSRLARARARLRAELEAPSRETTLPHPRRHLRAHLRRAHQRVPR